MFYVLCFHFFFLLGPFCQQYHSSKLYGIKMMQKSKFKFNIFQISFGISHFFCPSSKFISISIIFQSLNQVLLTLFQPPTLKPNFKNESTQFFVASNGLITFSLFSILSIRWTSKGANYLVSMVFLSLPTKKQLHAMWRHEGTVLLQRLVI